MTTATPVDYAPYKGKRVDLTYLAAGEGDAKTETKIVANVEAGTELGLMVKEKGKSSAFLVFADDIVSVTLADEKPKKLTVKSLKPVELGQARQHLVDRHGYAIEAIEDRTEQWAFDFHNSADVDHSKLAHNHDPKPERQAGTEAVAQAEATQAPVPTGDSDTEPEF